MIYNPDQVALKAAREQLKVETDPTKKLILEAQIPYMELAAWQSATRWAF